MIFKRKKNNRLLSGSTNKRSRSPIKKASGQKVISYYTASRRQLDNFERNIDKQSRGGLLSNRWLASLSKWWFKALVLMALLSAVVYLLSLGTSPLITIVGPQYRRLNEYNDLIAPQFQQDVFNRVKPLLKTDKLQKNINSLVPEARSVSVSTSLLGHRPIVKITTSLAIARFDQNDGDDLLISDRGRLLLPLNLAYNSDINMPVLQNFTGLTGKAGEQFMRPDETQAFIDLIGQFRADNISVIYSLPNTPHELEAQESGRGYKVKFMLNSDIKLQYGALRATQKKLQEINQSPSQYIDVRLADKAYYL